MINIEAGVVDVFVLRQSPQGLEVLALQRAPGTRCPGSWEVVHGSIEAGEPAPTAARPRVALNMALGALVGLVLGIGLAFFIEYLDTSVKTMDDVETLLGVPVLAIIPQNIGLLAREGGDSPDAEAYRILRTNIEFNRKSPDSNTISLVSGGPGEGKSTTLANLAYICAQGGYSTLVVDAETTTVLVGRSEKHLPQWSMLPIM